MALFVMKTFVNRHLYLIEFTLSSLLRFRGKNFSLLVVYTLVIFLLASVMLFSNALRHEASLVLAQSPEMIVQRMVAGRHDLLPADYLDKASGIRGVKQVSGRLWGYHYDPIIRANYTIMVDADRQLADGEIVIGAGIARVRGLQQGDYLGLHDHQARTMSFQVAGILDSDSELVSADLFLINASTYRAFFGLAQDVYTDMVLSVRNPREYTTIAEKIIQRLPDTRPILRDEILRTYDAIFAWRQGIVFVILMMAVLAFVIFAWDKASGLSAQERKEIGILKATGWETADVIRMKFWEGFLISVSAFILGYLFAYVHVFYADAALFEPVLKGWAILYPRFSPLPVIDALQIATLFFFSVFPYVLATIIPIWRVATTDPDAVMR